MQLGKPYQFKSMINTENYQLITGTITLLDINNRLNSDCIRNDKNAIALDFK